MLCITLIHAHAVDGQKTPRWLGLKVTFLNLSYCGWLYNQRPDLSRFKFLLFKIMTVPIGSFIYPQRTQISVLKLMIVWGLVKENANEWLPFWFGTHSSQIILGYLSARSQKHLFYNDSWGFFQTYFPSSYA